MAELWPAAALEVIDARDALPLAMMELVALVT